MEVSNVDFSLLLMKNGLELFDTHSDRNDSDYKSNLSNFSDVRVIELQLMD